MNYELLKKFLFGKKKKKEKGAWLKEDFKILGFAILLALLFRSLLFEPFHIPSGSMKSNLLIGDYILVKKYSYGYSRYSFPFGIVPITNRIFQGEKKPERGDVIVFKLPKDNKTNYIKRLIGLPGDEIQIKRGIVYINGSPVPKKLIENFTDEINFTGKKVKISIPQFEETLPNGKIHKTLDLDENGQVDNTQNYKVPKGHYFFMGDNRDASQDSRFLREVGFVPEKNLLGRAEIIFMSSKGSLLKFWQWHKNIRFGRIFDRIE